MKNLTIIALLCVSFFAKSQDYYHGAGVGYYIGMFNYETETGSYNESLGVPGAFYKATLGFEAGRSNTFAVSAYPFLGFQYNSQVGGYLGAELPILAEFYFGDPDDFCFYANGGFSAGYLNNGGGAAILGPQVGLGGQFEIRDNLIGLRASYTIGVNSDDSFIKDKRSAITLGVYYVFY